MQVGLVGLGRMGGRIKERLERGGHEVIAYDHDPATSPTASLEEVVSRLDAPRVVWVMVPSGAATDAVFETLYRAAYATKRRAHVNVTPVLDIFHIQVSCTDACCQEAAGPAAASTARVWARLSAPYTITKP